MANIGLTASKNPSPDTAQTNLMTWLFGDVAHARQSINGMFNDATGVRRWTQEAASGEDLAQYDVKFYCDQSRLKRRDKNPLQFYDTDPELKGGYAQEETEHTNCAFVLAYTVEPEGKFFQITFCPWFLKYAMEQKFQLGQNIPSALWAKMMKGFIPLTTKFPYTPIDAASLFDKVFLHELIHAHSSLTKVTDDVGGFWRAYGWKNCLKLSTKRGTQDDPKAAPEFNADTYALYGSASLMLSQGHAVRNDGTYG